MTLEIKDMLDAGLKSINAETAKLAEKQVALEKSMAQYEGQMGEKSKVDSEVKAEVKSLADEFAKINADITAMGQKMSEGFKANEEVKADTAGDKLVKSEAFAQFVKGNSQNVRLEVKNTVLSDGTTVFPFQKPGVIEGNFAPLTIRQVLPSIGVSGNMVNSLRESSFTNDAAFVAQGAVKPESDITFAPYNVAIETVAHFIKMSVQMLADAPAVASYINLRLRDGLDQRIDSQLLLGNGTTPNLSGLTKVGNFTAYAPVAGDNLLDAINRAKYALWAIGRQPDFAIVNPADFGELERLREGSGTGMYLYGTTGQAGVNPFGVRIVMSNNMPVGKFLVGQASSAIVYDRQATTVELGYINDDFSRNLLTLRAEARLGLGVERPTAMLYGDFSA